jgi:hypothetical protein
MLTSCGKQRAQVSDGISRPTLPWPLIRMAVLCSQEAYGATVTSGARQCTALGRTLVSQRLVDSHGKVVVVALSGTKGIRDWMVNLRNHPCDPKDVLVRGRILAQEGSMLI